MNSEVKKSLIALATLAAVSTSFAQVTVYGMADMYVGKSTTATIGVVTATPLAAVRTITAIFSGLIGVNTDFKRSRSTSSSILFDTPM